MTSADPTGAARRSADETRTPSPPPPLYEPSDEISLDDPIGEPSPPDEPTGTVLRRWSFDGPEPLESPTRADQRPGRPFRAFWLSFAANSSAAGIIVGALLFSSGMSLRQSIAAGAIGVVLSGLLLAALGRIGHHSGLPTLAASATVFGARGGLLPAVIVLVARSVLGGALLWVFAAATVRVGELAGIGSGGPLPGIVAVIIGTGLCSLCAATGYRGIAVAQRVLTPLAALALIWFVLTTLPAVDVRVAFTIGDGPGYLVISGAVLVLVLAGLLLLPAAGDVARFEEAGSSRVATGFWTALGAGIPALLLVTYGAVLAASAPATVDALLSAPVDAVTALLPGWYPLPLAIGIAAGTLSGAAVSLYSASLTAVGLGLRTGRLSMLGLSSVGSAGIAILFLFSGGGSAAIDFVTTVCVPLAAWVGVLVGGSIGAARPLPTPDTEVKPVRWLPVATVLVVTVIGFGFTSATIGWLSWQGFLFPLVGARPEGALAVSDPGILIAVLLGALVSILSPRAGTRTRRRGNHRVP